MKHSVLCFCIFVFAQHAFAALPKFSVDDVQVSLQSQQQLMLKNRGSMTLKEYEQRAGRKLNFIQELIFTLRQHHRSVNEANKKHPSNVLASIGGFLLGFFVPVAGVAIAYIFSKNKTFRGWALGGFCVFTTLFIFVLIGYLLEGSFALL